MSTTPNIKMSDEEKLIKVATMDGWRRHTFKDGTEVWYNIHQEGCSRYLKLPDYLNDFNLIRKVVSRLTAQEYANYGEELEFITGFKPSVQLWSEYRKLIEATAEQCTEALCAIAKRSLTSNAPTPDELWDSYWERLKMVQDESNLVIQKENRND